MTPGKIEGATHALGAPSGWDEATHGPCDVLHIRLARDGTCSSVWELTDEERAAIAAGGAVLLTVFGPQPAVSLGVLAP